jgi:hypothetical protein
MIRWAGRLFHHPPAAHRQFKIQLDALALSTVNSNRWARFVMANAGFFVRACDRELSGRVIESRVVDFLVSLSAYAPKLR